MEGMKAIRTSTFVPANQSHDGLAGIVMRGAVQELSQKNLSTCGLCWARASWTGSSTERSGMLPRNRPRGL